MLCVTAAPGIRSTRGIASSWATSQSRGGECRWDADGDWSSVTGDRDPGYGSTSKMIAEAALCLIRDVDGEGGVWTAGALMAEPLKARLEANAGLKFVVKS